MTDTALASNAYWDAVKDDVRPADTPWDPGPQVGAPDYTDPEWWRRNVGRNDYVRRYAWTITAPETVAFVVEHSGSAVVDPMAGSGWWAYLLGEAGVDVAASDLYLPGTDDNHWHRDVEPWVPITALDGVEAVRQHGAGRSLLLAWPPYDSPAGADILDAFQGDRVVFIGEGEGGCTGDDRLFALLDADWVEVAAHRPVQWYGIHDHVIVYDRKPA